MKVLVVDGDAEIGELVGRALRREGFEVITACDGADALTQVRSQHPGLVVLDHALAQSGDLEVCRALRAETDAPVLMLTTFADGADTGARLELGADDYLSKPVNPRELVSRVKAVLRRAERAVKRRQVHRLGRLQVNRQQREVHINDREVPMRPKEFDLLLAFIEQRGRVLSRERLLEQVWGYEVAGVTRTVDVHVNHLRGKLAGSRVTIETVRGVGYRLVENGGQAGNLAKAQRRKGAEREKGTLSS